MTPNQLQSVSDCWSLLAGESVKVEEIKTVIYAYGSELATLRLYHAFSGSPNIRQSFSDNLETFYFTTG